ncbi:unnamed protein product, partial [Phaeothamnion confervicola]
MDALSDVLRVVRLTGGVFLEARFTAPWSIQGKVEPQEVKGFVDRPQHVIGFHYVVSGRLLASTFGGEPVEAVSGDLVIFPRNDLHVLCSASDLKPTPVGAIAPDSLGLANLDFGGGGEETRLVCGYLGSDAQTNPVVSALPPLLLLNVKETAGGAWIAQSFAFAAQQLAEGAVGAATVVSELSELMFVEAVRRYVERLPP